MPVTESRGTRHRARGQTGTPVPLARFSHQGLVGTGRYARPRARGGAMWFTAALLALLGCRQDMHDQPRYEPLEKSSFFADGRSSRLQMPGTVARGQLQTDEHFYRGRQGEQLAAEFPFPLTTAVLDRGCERFVIFCSPCHGRLGDGEGMVAQRGFRHPPSYHTERLRGEPVGHFFDVITNGLGAMSDFSDRINPRDRWAIVAYIRALQLSQHAALGKLPSGVLQEFERSQKP